jgi:hypothetical protein
MHGHFNIARADEGGAASQCGDSGDAGGVADGEKCAAGDSHSDSFALDSEVYSPYENSVDFSKVTPKVTPKFQKV